MKPFKLLTPKEQRIQYRKNLRKSYTAALRQLKNKYETEFDSYDKLHIESGIVIRKIGDTEDKIANSADREFGTWKWREDKQQRALVADRMAEATRKIREEYKDIRKRSEKIIAPYNKERAKLTTKYDKLLATTFWRGNLMDGFE
jgi:predicted  nucleic acid-binding Zn-ribbon protein